MAFNSISIAEEHMEAQNQNNILRKEMLALKARRNFRGKDFQVARSKADVGSLHVQLFSRRYFFAATTSITPAKAVVMMKIYRISSICVILLVILNQW